MSLSNKAFRLPLCILIALFICCICWLNFHSALFYRMDTYTYSYEGRLMFEEKTCFPEHWIFSNQYQIIASPNFAALFYGLVHDSTTAMAWASSLSLLLVLLAFCWCFKGQLGGIAKLAGLLCISGGIIFGTSAGLYISGLQVLYTMASYYACYLIGILLTLGCWIRLDRGERPGILWILLVVVLNFSLGMQSLRQILILNIPLLLLEAYYLFLHWKRKDSFKSSVLENSHLWFVVALLAVELAGFVFMKSLNVATTPIIGELNLDLRPSALIANTWASAKNLLRISGIAIAADGLRYLPLTFCGLAVAIDVVLVVFRIIHDKDETPLAKSIVFAVLSVLCVFGIGVFLMRTRDIYYFTYWLLASLCIAYSIEHFNWNKWFIPSLTAICLINFYFNFVPDFKAYRKDNANLQAFTEHLIKDEQVRILYTSSRPIIAAASHGRIISQSFWLDVPMESGYPLTVFPSDKHTVIYDDEHYDGALFCFSTDYLDYLEKQAPDEYREFVMSRLEFVDSLSLSTNERFEIFRPVGQRILSPLVF